MSLESSGVSIRIYNPKEKTVTGAKCLGNGFDRHDAAVALRLAMEEFIASPKFKDFTESSCYQTIDVQLEFLLHTVMPR